MQVPSLNLVKGYTIIDFNTVDLYDNTATVNIDILAQDLDISTETLPDIYDLLADDLYLSTDSIAEFSPDEDAEEEISEFRNWMSVLIYIFHTVSTLEPKCPT